MNSTCVLDTESANTNQFISICACMLSHFSHVQLSATLWTVACLAPLFMEFYRQEYWSGLPFLSPGDPHDLGIKHSSLMSPALAGSFFTTSATWEALISTLKAKISRHWKYCLNRKKDMNILKVMEMKTMQEVYLVN